VFKSKRKLFIQISTITIILLLLAIGNKTSINLANAQTSPCDNGQIIGSSQILPVILIHGYAEPSNVWSTWEQLLGQNNIPFCTVSFHQSDDKCGSALSHAQDLAQIVQQVKSMTGQDKVNIVAHSKGGLDARVYLANTQTPNVANLVMIGTPNAGSPLADFFHSSDPCKPAVEDLRTDAADTTAKQNTNTNYYTIAGECLPFSPFISEPNDEFVGVSSVESLPYSTSLGNTFHCHTSLLNQDEFMETLPVLLGNR
jgi:pimeloyl-ACP methyl ester carboxylesterase